MFHVKHVEAAARFAGLELGDERMARLLVYRDWLATEARRAGAIGPGEISRIERRHIADSLLFASQFDPSSARVVDLGTGVGLPGVPLAVALPDTRFTLVDRSRGRVDLLRRVIRILELENCEVVRDQIEHLSMQVGVVVARGSLPPHELTPVVSRLLKRGGVAVVGGSWRETPSQVGWETIRIPRDVLDRRVWLLMMRSA